MLVPVALYGRYTDVRSRMRKVAEKVAAGKGVGESFTDRRTLETETLSSGYLNLFTHPDISIAQSHFHLTLLPAALHERFGSVDGPECDAVFAELMALPWGPLVFADEKDGFLADSLVAEHGDRRRRYFAAVRSFARGYERELLPFVDNRGRAGSFWEANTALRAALRAEGVSAADLARPLSAVRFESICRTLGL